MPRRNSPTRNERLRALEYQYTAVFERDPDGGYTVTVPALPGLVTEGDTFEEARTMAEEAIVGYLESLQKHGEEIPTEDLQTITTKVAVTLPTR